MTTTNVSPASPGKTKQVLEEKLKVHIQREFDLGEKVITLLKQKNELESGLQVQLNSKRVLEAQLSEAIAGKQTLEQEYAAMQRDLRAQQKSLRQRSRRFSVSEEDSREDLRALTEEIQNLKQQLELLDNQKVEEHVHLSNSIEELSRKEGQLQQEIQKISYQKEIAEEELDHTAQRLHTMSAAHEREKMQHEKEIERLQRQQAHMEIRIAHLLDEQQRNERSLQQEIETLKRSKAKLEEKVSQLRQQHPGPEEEAEKNLLQVIERQENLIAQLKERAHQRSSMLRAENETLKKEVETMLTKQEKINWENQMLESSLKSLQHDLAEYLLLKNKFEEAQREKEHFEEIFYRKMRFLEERYLAAGQPLEEEIGEPVYIHHHADRPDEPLHIHHQADQSLAASAPIPMEPAKSEERSLHKRSKRAPRRHAEEKTEKIPSGVWQAIWPKILIPIGAVLVLLLSATITLSLLKLFRPPIIPITAVDIPVSGHALPEDKFGLNQSSEDLFQDKTKTVMPEPEPTSAPVVVEPRKKSQSQPARAPEPIARKQIAAHPRAEQALSEPVAPAVPALPAAPVVRPEPPRVSGSLAQAVKKPRQMASIVVQLAPEGSQRFLPKERQPFPTVENNGVLRRYSQQSQIGSK